MSEYRIQSETLEGIADAIREKTGDSALIAPEDMATEIASISGGGSGYPVFLADYTTSEDVSSIQIDFTSEMQGYDYYAVVLTGAFNANEYPCIAFNEEPTTSAYLNRCDANEIKRRLVSVVPLSFVDDSFARYLFGATSGAKIFKFPISYFKTSVYYKGNYFKAGYNIKVWGLWKIEDND